MPRENSPHASGSGCPHEQPEHRGVRSTARRGLPSRGSACPRDRDRESVGRPVAQTRPLRSRWPRSLPKESAHQEQEQRIGVPVDLTACGAGTSARDADGQHVIAATSNRRIGRDRDFRPGRMQERGLAEAWTSDNARLVAQPPVADGGGANVCRTRHSRMNGSSVELRGRGSLLYLPWRFGWAMRPFGPDRRHDVSV